MSKDKALRIFVEGEYDTLFFDTIIRPRLIEQYIDVQCIEYARREPSEVRKKLKTFHKIQYYDHWFVADLDQHTEVEDKISKIKNKYGEYAEPIIIVKSEIECWYFSGLSDNVLHELKMAFVENTELLDKEQIIKRFPNFSTLVKEKK